MTRNQLEYARLLETRRSNMANEVLGGQQVQVSRGNLAELIRHNQAGEAQQGRSLDEAIRHNVQTENLNARTIQEAERSNRAREYETQRSNIAREHETLRSNVERENETARHNFVTEGQTNVSLSLSDQAQRELERSHRATETTNLLKVTEDARSNLARESETYRSNVARESEIYRSNIANEQERMRSNARSEELQKYGIDLNYTLQQQSNLNQLQRNEIEQARAKAQLALDELKADRQYVVDLLNLEASNNRTASEFASKAIGALGKLVSLN